jgi:penicillin-binding protein 1C
MDRPAGSQFALPLIASGGKPPYRWILSGTPQPPSPVPTGKWTVDGRGQFDISIIDAAGTIAKSSFWIE